MDKYEEIIEELKAKRDELEERLGRVEKSLRKPHDPDTEEQAIERENEEVVEALGKRIRAELEQINLSLNRAENNEFGICTVCGDDIPVKRLEALPYTDRCIRCAEESH